MSVRPVRGTVDLFPDDSRRHRRVSETARELAERYGFGEINTPIFEFTDVFARTLGDVSDVVTKEMYTFEDRGGERLTLRPENTAGVMRAFIAAKLQNPLKKGPALRPNQDRPEQHLPATKRTRIFMAQAFHPAQSSEPLWCFLLPICPNGSVLRPAHLAKQRQLHR